MAIQLVKLWLLSSLLAGVIAASKTAPDTTATTSCPPSYRCGDAVDIRYPFWVDDGNNTHCGYPSLRLECRLGTPVLGLPSGAYGVTRITYGDQPPRWDRKLTIFDLAVNNGISGICPHELAGRNLTLPAGSPRPFSLTHRDVNLTFYTNCPFFVRPSQMVKCLERADGMLQTYVFRDSDYLMPYSSSQLCEAVVGMPVLRSSMVNSTGPLDGLIPALKGGFELGWREAVGGECGACEKTGGSCGQRRDAQGSWTFICVSRNAPEPSSAGGASRGSMWILAIAVTALTI